MSDSVMMGRTILVTGGSGTIGSALVTELLKSDPRAIRVLSDDEHGLFQQQASLGDERRVRFLVGNVRDRERMARAMSGVDIVYHAAALKHVPLCEYNPFEALKTNVLGTQNCVEAAIDAKVSRFIFISTDKAVSPMNTMGATKFLAERLVIDGNRYVGSNRTAFSSVRFGNVLKSRGSVVETFARQIRTDQKPTITDARMTRFVMPIGDATKLILKATQLCSGGEIFILRMPTVKIVDLLEAVRLQVAPTQTIQPVEIGLRPGEKLHEELMTASEAVHALESDEMFIVRQPDGPSVYPGFVATEHANYSSAEGPFLSPAEICALLKRDD